MRQLDTPSPHGASQNAEPPGGLRLGNGCNGSARKVWHASAPKAVRRAFVSGDRAHARAAWQDHLAKRKRPADPDSLLASKKGVLNWGLPDGLDECPQPTWLVLAESTAAKRGGPDSALENEVLHWLGESAGTATGAGYALEVLAVCRAMRRLAAVLSSEVWWAVLDHLFSVVADAGALKAEDDPLVNQLLSGELALTLAYLFPEVAPCRALRSAARRALSAGPVDLLDGEGIPHARHLAVARPLLACWTRCCALGNTMKGSSWTKTAAHQFEWFVRQSLRLARPDGSQVFSRGTGGKRDRELFAAALGFDHDKVDRAVARVVMPGVLADRRVSTKILPEPAADSQWACVAVLRPKWSRSAARLTAAYPGRRFAVELSCGKDVIFSGVWDLDVRVDGRPAAAASDWSQLCWFSDEDVDYLEAELDYGGGLRVQRQIVLAREDRLLLLADAVLGADVARLEYRGSLPLCPEVSFRGADESREGYLVGRKPRALAMPLALPEWRSDQRVGRLEQTEQGLQLQQSTDGRRLYAPLLLDLDQRRMTRRRTWRQLTVAESMAIQPPEVAVGYRAAVGKAQWLIYRSLAEKANRTLLGHNLSTEMLVARFRRTGEVEALLEVE